MSVDKHVFLEVAHRIFLSLLKKVRCLKGEKLTIRFLGKNLILRIMPQNTPKIGFSEFCKEIVH